MRFRSSYSGHQLGEIVPTSGGPLLIRAIHGEVGPGLYEYEAVDPETVRREIAAKRARMEATLPLVKIPEVVVPVVESLLVRLLKKVLAWLS